MIYYICLCVGALFGYVLGAIMATGSNSDKEEHK